MTGSGAPITAVPPAPAAPAQGPRRAGRTMAVWLIAGALAGCASSGTVSLLMAPAVPGLPQADSWFGLPVHEMLTRPTIRPLSIMACPAAECGVDSVLGVFEATGAEATRLQATLADADQAARLARGSSQAKTKATAQSEPFSKGPWSGRLITYRSQGTKRAATIASLSRPYGDTRVFIVSVSESPEAARSHAIAAAQE
jgi:hypothetical protein